MTRRQARVALLVLGTAMSAPILLNAGSKTQQHSEVPKQVQQSSKQYEKQMKKQQKQLAKMQKKQAKQNARQNKNRVQTTHSVTG